jgi:hypothetical protein
MKIYHGHGHPTAIDGASAGPRLVYVTTADGKYDLSPKPSQKLFNHSPDGFQWGYGGSGPAQLALAILLDYLGDKDEALRLHQPFKWAIIARLPKDKAWEIDALTIEDFLRQHEVEAEREEDDEAVYWHNKKERPE